MMFKRVLLTAVTSALFATVTMAAPDAAAQAADRAAPPKVRLDTPSGMPVPRFVSLKAGKTYCRAGPTFEHPVRITYMQRGLPVMVVAETHDYWRKIRDSEADECWIHKSKLSGEATALVMEEGLVLRTRARMDAPEKALLGRGLVVRVERQHQGWLLVSIDGIKGWAAPAGLWGVDRNMF